MSLKMIVSAITLLVSATTFASAQSLPNYGPNAPANGDSFGKPYSGAQPLREKGSRYSYQHHRAHHRTARSSSQSQTEGAAPSK